MAAPDAQQYVAQFEQCVAALQTGANAAQATKTLLALREDPRCLEIAQPRARLRRAPRPGRGARVSAAALRAFAALWARGFADAARGPKEATRALARDVLAKVKAAAGDRGDVLCNALGALVQQFSGLENTLGVAKGLRDAARQRVETQALFDVAKIAFGALRARGRARRRAARRRGGGGARGAGRGRRRQRGRVPAERRGVRDARRRIRRGAAAAARTFDDAVAELRSAADLVSAVFGAAGGASQVAADVLGPLLEASARNCDWVASRCVERAAAATAAVVDAARQRTNHGLVARAAAAADDADAALDEGLAPLLEAWALVAGDEAVVLYDAAAEGSNAQPPWLHAVVAEVGASVFGRYARCRVEAARAQAAAGVWESSRRTPALRVAGRAARPLRRRAAGHGALRGGPLRVKGDADAAHDDLDEALRVVDALVSDDLFGDDDGADAVGAGLACLGFLVPNLDADLLCRRADAARKFYGSVAAAVDAAPERVAGHASLGAVVPALHFGYGLPDAVAARAALVDARPRGLLRALDGAARGAAAETWLACAGALLRPLLAHAGAVWDRADDAADALLALFAAADGAAPAAVAAAVAPADGAAAAQLGEDVAALAAHAAQLLRSAGAPSLAAALRRRETRRLWRDAFAAFLTKARGYLIQS
ncbi:hypothetical protein JL722_8676 [Aureococcus anophagefferens]|nr:hypothetical protein JL722_8676 [Aureococcus anophagefferens]